MQKTNIEWADMTWNPVVGCKHGCEYCYARRIAKRFGGYDKDDGTITTHNPLPRAELHQPLTITRSSGKTVNSPFPFGFEPTLLYYRLWEPQRIKKPQTIFVCSMADLFGNWVPTNWIKLVLDACEAAPQHRYMFLTKNPARYLELDKVALLPHQGNFWYGSTVPDETAQAMYPKTEGINVFWSMEPLLGPVDITKTEGLPKFIILGAMTGPGSAQRQPEREWVRDTVTAADGAGIPIFMKDSLKPIVREANMRREFPWETATGRWKEHRYGTTLDPACFQYYCSICNGVQEDFAPHFCPHCGASMSGIDHE